MINNGRMRIESGDLTGGNYAAFTPKETDSSLMYLSGWNLLWYTLTTTLKLFVQSSLNDQDSFNIVRGTGQRVYKVRYFNLFINS